MDKVHERRRAKEELLTAAMAKEIWELDERADGQPILRWKERPLSEFYNANRWRNWNSKYAWREAGSVNCQGYVVVTLDYIQYMLHRLIWLMIKGSWPADQLDHIDQDSSNNRISNLREVTNQENQRNVALQSNNSSGVTGICWKRDRGAWCVRISDQDGRRIHLGYHATLEEARFARKQGEAKYGYHPHHGRKRAAKA